MGKKKDKEKGKKSFDERFPPMSKQDIAKAFAEVDKAKAKYSMDTTETLSALTEYLGVTDPILWTNPRTGKTKAIAWVCRPTMKELKALIPPQLRKYANKPQDLPEELGKQYEKFFYEKMAETIAIPKWTAEEWEEKGNPWIVRLFWNHIAGIARLMEGNIEGF